MENVQKLADGYGKVCPIICLILSLGIQLGIMIPYFNLSGIASQYNGNYLRYEEINAGSGL